MIDEDGTITAALAILISETMTVPELVASKEKVERAQAILSSESNQINSQIEEATSRKLRDGQYAEPEWWRRVNAAKRAKAWQRQRLQEKIGAINRCLRIHHHAETMREDDKLRSDRARAFVEVARLHLPAETYQKLWNIVKQLEH